MNEELEFHYVVSYREGIGWSIQTDTEQEVFPNGTVYDWDTNTWLIQSDIVAGEVIEETDLKHFSRLNLALVQLNALLELENGE
jgi:hypothetical protein